MLNENSVIDGIITLNKNIRLMKIHAPQIAGSIKSGQFVNVKISDFVMPLLRRPFSVCDVEGECFYIMFNIVGQGTELLAKKTKGEELNILGPLGNGFDLEGNYETAIFVMGGIGAAPFPYLYKMIKETKEVFVFNGGRTLEDVVNYGFKSSFVATDDGSAGFKGNVVQLLQSEIELLKQRKFKIFGCGPTPMLKALSAFARENRFECEISTESQMACGFGICQGCPVESAHQNEKYLLVCKDGPVFNVLDIVL